MIKKGVVKGWKERNNLVVGGKEKKIARTRVHPVPQICTFVELRVVDTCFKINISGCF